MNSFSLSSSSLRAASHSAGGTIFAVGVPVVGLSLSVDVVMILAPLNFESFFSPFFLLNTLTTSAVNPPVDTTLPATNPALAMQTGHMEPSHFEAASARALMREFM